MNSSQTQCGCGKSATTKLGGGFQMCEECWKEQLEMFTEYKKNRRFEPSIDRILDNLYLGNEDVALQREVLQGKKNSHIGFPDEYTYKTLSLQDWPEEDIKRYFEEAAQFIHSALKEGKSLFVHCVAEISRSATIVQKRTNESFKKL